MIWFLVGSVFFLVVHQALEGLVVAGEKAVLRKLQWDLGTALLIVALVAAAVVLTFVNFDWRARVGPVVVGGAPLALAGAGVYAYLSYLVYSGKADAPADLEGREAPVRLAPPRQ